VKTARFLSANRTILRKSHESLPIKHTLLRLSDSTATCLYSCLPLQLPYLFPCRLLRSAPSSTCDLRPLCPFHEAWSATGSSAVVHLPTRTASSHTPAISTHTSPSGGLSPLKALLTTTGERHRAQLQSGGRAWTVEQCDRFGGSVQCCPDASRYAPYLASWLCYIQRNTIASISSAQCKIG
jgi:hypothetical protein